MNNKNLNTLFQIHFGLRPKAIRIKEDFSEIDFSKMLKSQMACDQIKKSIGRKNFDYGLDVYFSQFWSNDSTLNFSDLKKDLTENISNYSRHLGPIKVDFLILLLNLWEKNNESNV